MPDVEQLRAFVTAVECGSFSAAARKLGRAQSAVSTTISNLEIDLDLSLFDRGGYRPTLTEAGESLLNHAISVLNSLDALHGQANALSGAVEPKFSFVVEDGLLVDRVRSLFMGISETFPGLQLNVTQLSRTAILDSFPKGDANAAFMCQAPQMEQHYKRRGIGFQRVVPVCHADHSLAQLTTIGRQDLARYRQVVEQNSSFGVADNRMLSPDIWVSESQAMRKALVMDGLAWAELPVAIVEKEVLSGDLKVIEYEFAQNAILKAVDFLTSNTNDQGPVMRWISIQVSTWDQRAWIGDHRVGRR